MGLQTAPGYILKQSDGTTDFQHPIELARNLTDAMFARRSGVLQYGDFAVTTPGSGLTVNIAAGAAAIHGVESSTQGAYFVWSNASDAVSFGAPSASTRYDTILIRVADNQYGSIPVAPQAYFDVVAGASGAGAARADSFFNTGGGAYVPGAWYRLADVKIDPGDTSVAANKIFQTFNYVNGPGGLILCSSTNRPPGVAGRKIYETDTNLEYFWDLVSSSYKMSRPYKQTIDISSNTSSITFSGIPRTLRTVKVYVRARASNSATFINLCCQIGGDTGANYTHVYRQVNNASGSTLSGSGNNMLLGYIAAATSSAGRFGNLEIRFTGWNATSGTLTAYQNGGHDASGSDFVFNDGVGTYSGANAWNSITLFPNTSGQFVAGSQFVLEGWD
jgi:hypothetical protein